MSERTGLRALLPVLLAGAVLAALAGCATTRQNLGSDFAGTLEPVRAPGRVGPCGEAYGAEEGMELSLIRQQLDDERPRAALAYLDKRAYPYPEAQLMQAEAMHRTGALAASDARYRGLLATCLKADGLRGLGRNAFAAGHADEALRYLREARHADPADARVRNDLGYLLLLRADYRAAAEELMTALELDDGLERAANNLVLALLGAGEPARAAAAAQRYRLDPAALEALRAAIARRQGAPAGASAAPSAAPVASPVQENRHETP